MKAILMFFITTTIVMNSCSYYYQDRQLMKRISCKKKHELTSEERKNQFQLKETPKIAFASFKKDSDNIITMGLEVYFEEVKMDFSKFNLYDFHEIRFLSDNDLDAFSDLIYNYGINKETNEGYDIMCYEPHNAVLFLNDNNTLKGFIEICFDCNKYYSSNQEIYNLGEYCNTKLKILKEQFLAVGITYVGNK